MSTLHWYNLQLAIDGIVAEHAQQLVTDLQVELLMRPHFRTPLVRWEGDSGRVIVDLEREAREQHTAAATVAEELLEATCAVIDDFDVIRIELLSVHLISQQ